MGKFNLIILNLLLGPVNSGNHLMNHPVLPNTFLFIMKYAMPLTESSNTHNARKLIFITAICTLLQCIRHFSFPQNEILKHVRGRC